MLVIEYIKEARWSNEEKTAIDLKVKFTDFDEVLDYTCSLKDKDSKYIFNEIAEGNWCEIDDFIPIIDTGPEITQEEIEARLKKVTKVQEV